MKSVRWIVKCASPLSSTYSGSVIRSVPKIVKKDREVSLLPNGVGYKEKHPRGGKLHASVTEGFQAPFPQIYLVSPSRFPVMTDLSCRVISASEA
jgi:hypothetical protein